MSELRANTISDAAGTGPVTLTGQYAAKARWHYEQASNSITDSFNVSSISDDATGEYTASLTNSMENVGFSVSFGSGPSGGSQIIATDPTTSAVDIDGTNRNGSPQNVQNAMGLVTGDLA